MNKEYKNSGLIRDPTGSQEPSFIMKDQAAEMPGQPKYSSLIRNLTIASYALALVIGGYLGHVAYDKHKEHKELQVEQQLQQVIQETLPQHSGIDYQVCDAKGNCRSCTDLSDCLKEAK